MSEVGCGTTYEWAQNDMRNKEPMAKHELRDNMANIGAWFSSNWESKYYMLLNRELSDYTIFNFKTKNYNKAVEDLYDLFAVRGPILDIDYNHDYHYFEIWTHYQGDDTPHMYILFQCPDFVIEV